MGMEVEKMIVVGLVWGTTNAFMRRGALTLPSSNHNLLSLLLTWQYTVPFLINLSASAAFFSSVLSSTAPISVAVPVTNATTFAATAAAAWALGETTRVPTASVGTALIVAGVYLCCCIV